MPGVDLPSKIIGKYSFTEAEINESLSQQLRRD
jgi:hypothetical protein